jgi:hypothetical protein
VPVGEVRIVGKVSGGTLTFEPGVDRAQVYLVVTKAFAKKLYFSLLEIDRLKLELKKCQEGKEKR